MTGNDDLSPYASPACSMHELDPGYLGPPRSRADIMAWRKSERERLIAARLAVPVAERQKLTTKINAALTQALGELSGKIVSAWWPFRGEPDLRPWMDGATARGATCALPVVTEKNGPLTFRAWQDGDPMERGIWNILAPAKGAIVTPDVVLAPLVGFDAACYRLGYGGGYFDRTLAGMTGTRLVVGVGYAMQRIASLHPLDHDIPMDLVITEDGVVERCT